MKIALIIVMLAAAAAMTALIDNQCRPGDRGVYIGSVIKVSGC